MSYESKINKTQEINGDPEIKKAIDEWCQEMGEMKKQWEEQPKEESQDWKFTDDELIDFLLSFENQNLYSASTFVISKKQSTLNSITRR